MSTWNYRPIRFEKKLLSDPVIWWELREVYYDDDGKPTMMSDHAAEIAFDDRDTLIKALEMMLKDAREREPFEPPAKWLEPSD